MKRLIRELSLIRGYKMEYLAIVLLEEFFRGVLGKVIGIGLVFTVARSTISQRVSFPDVDKLKNYGVTLPSSIESKVTSARKNHGFLTCLVWFLLAAYMVMYTVVISPIPQDATEIGALEVFCIYALAIFSITALFLSYYLVATESKAKELVQYGKLG